MISETLGITWDLKLLQARNESARTLLKPTISKQACWAEPLEIIDLVES